MFTMPSRRPAGGRRTTALLAALVTLPAVVACSAPSEVVPVAAVSARHAAPADLAVTTEGDALTATWAAPPTATSMDVTGYELYVDDAAVVTLDAGTTSHRLAGVRPGDRVYVQVRAVGVDGPGQLAEASTEQVWATPTARPRSAVVEEAQAVTATPGVAATSVASTSTVAGDGEPDGMATTAEPGGSPAETTAAERDDAMIKGRINVSGLTSRAWVTEKGAEPTCNMEGVVFKALAGGDGVVALADIAAAGTVREVKTTDYSTSWWCDHEYSFDLPNEYPVFTLSLEQEGLEPRVRWQRSFTAAEVATAPKLPGFAG